MTTEQSTNRPYAPPSNVTTLLERLRTRNLPERIDTEYLRDSGIPESTVHRTLFALKFLNLVNEANEPSQDLKSIHVSPDEDYRAILAGLIQKAYKDVFSVVDPSQDTQDKISNVFRRYTPASQRSRMVIFFLGMCREAGIPLFDVPRSRSMVRVTPAKINLEKVTKGDSTRHKEKGKAFGITINVSPALEGLIRSLPSQGTPMSEERRNQWLDMAKATLKFLYPEENEESAKGVEPEDLPF